MVPIIEQIEAYARGLAEGVPIVAKSLLHLGTRAAIDKALSRLAASGKLIRAARGIYFHPVVSRFGVGGPTVEAAIAGLAAQTGEVIVPAGAAAANRLGLSTQVPVRYVYLTSGPSRYLAFGKLRVEIRHAPRWLLFNGASMEAGELVRALEWLGPENAEANLASVMERLPPTVINEVRAGASRLPEWLARSIAMATHA